MKKIPASTIVPWTVAALFYLLSFSYFQDGNIKSFVVYMVYSTALVFLGWKIKNVFIATSVLWTLSPLFAIQGVSAFRTGSVSGFVVGLLLGAALGFAGWALRNGKDRADILRAVGVENPDIDASKEKQPYFDKNASQTTPGTDRKSWPKSLKIGIVAFLGLCLVSAVFGENTEESDINLADTSVETTVITAQKVTATTTQVTTSQTTITTTTPETTTTVQSTTTTTQATTTTPPATTVTEPATTRAVQQLNSSPTVYVTRTGKKYHYSNSCNGGTYIASNLDEAKSRGLEECDKCA